jgi:NodT family efflux transporter outer membrane factor (OMF) lipoprotein
MRTCFRLSLIALGTVLAGCAVGPDYLRPELRSPNAFVNEKAVAGRAATQSAALESWWNGFDDPKLNELVTRATAQNLDLAQAQSRVAQSRASLQWATAALLPSGNVSAEGAHARLSTQTPVGQLLNASPGFDRNGGLYEVDLGASWEIDVFGGLQRAREAKQAEYQAASAGAIAVRLAVAAAAADNYIVIRGLQTRLDIARKQWETQRQLVATVELQFRSGIAADLQVNQAKGALSQVAAAIPALESNLEAAFNSMDVLLGQQPGTCRTELAEEAPIPAAPAIQDVGGPADLIRRRPDLIVAERKLAAANAGVGAAISEYYPKFSLSGLVGSATTVASSSFSSGAIQTQGVLGLRWRLFDFGRVDAEIKAARGRDAEELAAYRLSVLRASEDVEDAFTQLVKSEEEDRELEHGLTSLSAARDQSLLAYKSGVVSLIEVLDADNRLLSTRDAEAQA